IRSARVVSLIDTAPTLLDLAGIAAPAEYQGRSVLDGEARLALFFADYSRGLLGLRDGPMKFIDDLDTGRGRLFDLDRDPHEMRDIAAAVPGRSAWYRVNLRRWSTAQRRRLDAAVQPR